MALSPKVCLDCNQSFNGKRDARCPQCGSEKVMPLPDVPKSVLVIEFVAPGSTQFELQMEGLVTVGQLEALAHDLLSQAQYTRWAQIHQAALAQQEAQKKDEPKIIVPTMQMKPS